MKKLTPKAYDFSTIKVLTPEQLQEHYKLYVGYVNKLNEIDNLPRSADMYKGPNPTYSAIRSIKLGESYAFDGVLLHELYFENITKCSCCAHGKLIKLIDAQWNDFENFMNYLKEVALSVRGWAIVTLDKFTDSLRIIGCDAHDVGPLWCAAPILVIDVYEHAYFLDYGTDRAKYIDAILKSINWQVINKRVESLYK